MIRTLVFTDVVDSTRLTERLGDAGAARLWAEHDRRARELLARHQGREIDRSDGFLLVFERGSDATQFARGYHEALSELGLTARIGMHAGPVTLRENAAEDVARGAKPIEVDGLAKPLAARVMALARGGQTLVTAALREAGPLQAHGHYRLKGIAEPVEILEPGSVPGLPPADTDKAYRVVRTGDVWLPVRAIRHNLPAERDAFVGRGAELRALADRLDGGARLVTVLGPGGTGKTRLVRRYGLAFLGDWPGGVYFCDLSEARSLDGIHFAVAAALDVPLGRGDAGVQLGHAIAGRGRCLVILDNFEQVVEHAAATVGRWLDRALDAAFVVTSRERLHVTGEEVDPVEPLPVGGDAIELFALRARAQRPDFALTEANRAAVAEVVRLLDGLPLAVELAAARIRTMSPEQLALRMRDRFAILAGARGVAARQATMRAAIDWSWELLSPWEQDAFAQCSVFDGGFTLDAAESVLDLSRWREAPPAMDVVQALSDKSLLRTWVPGGEARYGLDEPFFGMYLSIREYASEKLAATGDAVRLAAQARHGSYFARFGSDEETEALFLHGGVRRRRALALEIENLVAACRRAVVRGDGAVAASALRVACDILELTGPYDIGVALGAQVLQMSSLDDDSRACALTARSMALRRAGRIDDAAAALETALTLYRALGNRHREAFVLLTLGNVRRDQGRHHEARSLQETALAIAREVGYRRIEGHALGNLGILHAYQRQHADARRHFEQALAIHREVGNRYIEGIETSNLGNVCRESGSHDEARGHFERALAIDLEVGNRRDEGIVMANLGLLAGDIGRHDEARARFESALPVAREVGDPSLEGYILNALGNALRNLDRIDDARAALRAGDARLRGVGTAPSRISLLCDWAEVEAAAGDPEAARAKLAEAGAVLEASGLGIDSEVGRQVAALRETLA